MPNRRLNAAMAVAAASVGTAPHTVLAQAPASASQEVRVTATPLSSDGFESPQSISVLRGIDLSRRQSATLGETLSFEPGVQSSGFGIAAGRPIIRGLDGPRIRTASDGLETLDISAISPDHAVTADPLSARQVEVLRGPATLLYGGGAIGGLVNVVSERIPQTRLTGVQGEALAHTDSATHGGQGALSLRGGAQGLNWTLGGFGRTADDYEIPGHAVVNDPGSPRDRLPNSFARSRGGSAGVSYVGQRLTAGVAHSQVASRYGIPSADASIRLRQQRTEGLLELAQPAPGVESLRLRHAENRYRHDEIEETGEVGTAFRNRGRDSRIELRHLPVGGVRGVLGVQLRDRTFGATGEEAYVPTTRERFNGLFYVGERRVGAARIEFGARHERARLEPQAGDDVPSRRFGLKSASLGAVLPIGSAGYAVGAQVSSSQRAPAIEELYASGPHAATRTFEIGNAALPRERATNFELSLRRNSPTLDWKVAAFVNRFRDYIFARLTDDDGDGIPDRTDDAGAIENSAADPGAGELQRVAYDRARATFRGVEAEVRWRPQGLPVQLRGFADTARGTLTGAGNVPRMSPTRLGASVDYAQGPWSGFVSLLSAQRQSRVAALETATASYRRLDAELAYGVRLGASATAQLFVQGRNLLNDEIRLHTSFIKDVAPQPGRSVLAGVRGRF